jgi:hypothetical protein
MQYFEIDESSVSTKKFQNSDIVLGLYISCNICNILAYFPKMKVGL